MTEKPLVSVIIALKDETDLFIKCIESLTTQSYDNIEIIIVDDGSKNETLELLNTLNNNNTRIIQLSKSQGQSYARNLAISKAKGKYIAIADADDYYDNERIKEQVEYLERHDEVDVLGTNFYAVNGHAWPVYFSHQEIFFQLLLNNPLIHSSVMMRASSLDKPCYRTEFDTAEDYDLFVKNAMSWKFAALPAKLIHYTIKAPRLENRAGQKEKAKCIREVFVRQLIPEIGLENLERLSQFGELDKGMGVSEIKALFKFLSSNIHTPHTLILHRILYRHLVQYCIKNKLKPGINTLISMIAKRCIGLPQIIAIIRI